MAQQIGRSLLLKRESTPGSGTYVTTCGMKARSFTIENEVIDTTVPDCALPTGKVMKSGVYGIQTMSFEGGGMFDNDAVSKAVHNDCLNQVKSNWQVVVPGAGVYAGQGLLPNIKFSGAEQGNLEFESSFVFDGTVIFTAE